MSGTASTTAVSMRSELGFGQAPNMNSWVHAGESATETAADSLDIVLSLLGTILANQSRIERVLKEQLAMQQASAVKYASVAEDYAKRLAELWPEASVYSREDVGILSIVVIGEAWDGQKEYAAYHLRGEIWPANATDLFIDINVFFDEDADAMPDLAGYAQLV